MSGGSSEASWEQCGARRGCFPFHFNWKVKFLDKGEKESHLGESSLLDGAK